MSILYSISKFRLETYDSKAPQASRSPVPKFASFRSKEPALPRDEGVGPLEHHFHGDEPSAKTKRRHKNGPKDGQRWRHRDARELLTSPEPSTSSFFRAEPPADAFIVDRNGDPKNLIFGTPDQYAISVYSRIGAGNVLGANLGYKIDRIASNEKGIVLSAQEGVGRHETHPLRIAVEGYSPELRVKKEAMSQNVYGRARDFIPLRSGMPTNRKRGDDSASLGTSFCEDEHTHYRSILGTSSPAEEFNDSDLEYPSESLNARKQPRVFDDQFQRKKAELAQRVDSEPSNAEAWLQFIHYEDASLGSRPTAAERRSTADIKMAMYKKALGKVKGPEGRQHLLIEMMEEASKFWDSRRLATEWSAVLKSNPDVLGLWIAFLDFKQTDFSSFKYESIRSTVDNCISVLQKCLMQSANDTCIRKPFFESQISIFLRMTLFMRESGFLENAVAAWQARLELEFFAPPIHLHSDQSQDSSEQEKISKFEQFWESEVPRIGEDGAKGWATFCRSEGLPPDPETTTADQKVSSSGDLFSAWIAMERQNTLLSRRPARTIDNMTGNDPYRVVLFSDVESLLTTSSSLHERYVLLEAFLIFCRLPSHSENHTRRIWSKSGFLRNEALHSDREDLFSSHNTGMPHDQGIGQLALQLDLPQHSAFMFPNLNCQLDTEILYAKQGSWFSAFTFWRSNTRSTTSPVEPLWVLSVLKSLLNSEVGDDRVAEYVLALELCLSLGDAKTTARSLLKQRTSSLRLYNAYALIEYRLNNAGKGEKALIAAINMSKDLDTIAKRDCILLWRTWIWELLKENKSMEAFSRIQAYADENVEPVLPRQSEEVQPSPAQTLRTGNDLRAFRDHMLTLHSIEHAVHAMECLILLAYLRDTSTLSAAMAAFTASSSLLSVNSTDTTSGEESLRQKFAHLLYHHATHTHLFRPSEIRSCLAESIVRFPENTIFLSLYAWNETRFRIDDRVRATVQDVVLGANKVPPKSQESVVSHFFAIHTEVTRGVARGSNENAIRASFERAVESKGGAHCAGIWKMYFVFEHSLGDLKRATAVFHRGIRACPWVKELYLLPFEYLRDGPGAMQDADLKGVYDLMVEKELRVHVDLEELIKQKEG